MESTAGSRTSASTNSWFGSVVEEDPLLDVPDMLAGRIGELYAAEERKERKQRTDRLMWEASHLLAGGPHARRS